MEPVRTIGRYRVLSTLGTGAMGEVLRARDERLGRDVAVKRVKNVFGAMTAAFHARFEAEARALAALAHPSVVQVFDLGIEGDEPYLVMELVEGPTLRGLLERQGALPVAGVRALGIQLARALEAAHARGILHRDVKPANVLQAPGGVWKLADFGVAHVPDSDMTMTGQFIGTPAYAAPEAIALGTFSPASDVFGLAVTLVEAATGAKPRRDGTLAEMIARTADPVSLEGVPRELIGPLRAALALEAERRPSAGELAARLAGDESAGAGPSTVVLGPRSAATPPAGVARASGTVAVPDATAGGPHATAGGTVAVPDETVPPLATSTAIVSPGAGPAPRRRWPLGYLLGAAVIAVIVVAIATSGGGDEPRPRGAGGILSAPAADPAVRPGEDFRPGEPVRFDMPPGLDRKGAHEWRKIADKVHKGDYEEALEKLGEFEERFGATDASQRLGRWLEQAAAYAHD